MAENLPDEPEAEEQAVDELEQELLNAMRNLGRKNKRRATESRVMWGFKRGHDEVSCLRLHRLSFLWNQSER